MTKDYKFETDVLIVGSGPAGSAASALLSSYGIKNMVVTKYGWLANTPRAHITNQRALEICRELGVEEEVYEKATPNEWMGNNIFCESLVGEEIGRLHSWGNHPNRKADYTLASPTTMCDCPQPYMEHILVGAGARRGSKYRFDTEFIDLEQDSEGVTATVRDRIADETYKIRAQYLLGADGANSKVAEVLDLPLEGQMGLSGTMNIVCNMDLTKYVAHRPSVLYWVIQPGSSVGGLGMGLIRMVRPWHKWMAIWGYDMSQGELELTDEKAIEIVHNIVGDDSIPVEIESTSTWKVNHCYATTIARGRVFCMGDAIHRHPPTNGLGSNTSMQDAWNLAWKVAMVIKGQASDSLLNSYQQERAGVAKQVVDRANKSIDEFGPIFQSLGLLDSTDPNEMKAKMEARKEPTTAAEDRREALRKAIMHKSYEYNCHGVELNQRYKSDVIVSDGTEEPTYERDEQLYYQATTWPGAHLPHVWLGKDNHQVSTLDVSGKGKFTVFTGIGGEAWVEAAKAIGAAYNMEITTVEVGPGKTYTDLFGEWAEVKEIRDSGCLLVRPDHHIAFRANEITQNAEDDLREALRQILGR